jgi:hypothetical protein
MPKLQLDSTMRVENSQLLKQEGSFQGLHLHLHPEQSQYLMDRESMSQEIAILGDKGIQSNKQLVGSWQGFQHFLYT